MKIKLPKRTKKHANTTKERTKLLEYIENNASKSDFVVWLNNQHGGAYSEVADWTKIKAAVMKDGVPAPELRTYAASLSSDADIKKLLKDVEAQTSEAQLAADKLSLLSTLKKFAVATGGACLLSGVILVGFAVLLLLNIVVMDDLNRIYLIGAGLLVGFLQIVAGLLLVSE